MKEEEKTVRIYIADDGKEFIDKDACAEYETKLGDYRKNLVRYIFNHGIDMTETGALQRQQVFYVYSELGCHREIAQQYVTRELDIPLVGAGVMGYGFQRHFNLTEIYNDDFNPEQANDTELVVILAPESKQNELIEYVSLKTKIHRPKIKTFGYMKEWGFK